MNELERYYELYSDMASSKDVNKMKAFGEAEKWAYKKMTEISPKTAQAWLEKIEASRWNNYLSKAEADEITAKLVAQDGTRGGHWSYETFKSAVEGLGGEMSDEPFYNCYALWVVANMLWSDHYKSAKMYVPDADMPAYFYSMALEKLKDIDRPHFVRNYFSAILSE